MSSVQAEWTRAVSLATLGVWQGAREASTLLTVFSDGRSQGVVTVRCPRLMFALPIRPSTRPWTG